MPRLQDPSPPKVGPGSAFHNQEGMQGKRSRKRLKKATKEHRQNNVTADDSSLSWTDDAPVTSIVPNRATNTTTTSSQSTATTTTVNVVSTVKKKKSNSNNKRRVDLFASDDSDSDDNTAAIASRHQKKQLEKEKSKKPFPSKIIKSMAVFVNSSKNTTGVTDNKSEANVSAHTKTTAIRPEGSTKKNVKSAFSGHGCVATHTSQTKGTISILATGMTSSHAQVPKRGIVTLDKCPQKVAKSTITVRKKTAANQSSNVSIPKQQMHDNHCDAVPEVVQPPNRYAMAFDTRFVKTDLGRKTGETFLNECHAFLESLSSRGAEPSLLVHSTQKEITGSRKRPVLAVRVADSWHDEDAKPVLVATFIAPPINMANKVNRKAVQVPKPLLANNSWKHFGEMVEAILEHDAEKNQTFVTTVQKQRPLNITIISSDLSFCCDINGGSHKRAMNRFWDLVEPFFEDGTLRSIHIDIIKTGVIAMANPIAKETEDGSPISLNEDKENARSIEEGLSFNSSGSYSDTGELMVSQTDQGRQNESRILHEIAVAQMIRAVTAAMHDRAELDAKMNRIGRIKNCVHLVDLSISMFDATAHPRLAFKYLLRRHLREIVSAAASAMRCKMDAIDVPANRSTISRICLQLPTTLDGNQCAVSLDVSYKLLPFALERPGISAGFFVDLAKLTDSKFEMVQQVPLAVLDASFIYGVQMSVRAGLEDDYDHYVESQIMTRALLKSLQAKQVALLLQINTRKDNSTSADGSLNGVFHNAKRGQTFLLMAEESVGGAPSTTGILCRYASADDLLLETEQPAASPDVPQEVVEQYESYVDNALDLLDCTTVNPLTVDLATIEPPRKKARLVDPSDLSSAPSSPDEDNRWNDSQGVGALQSVGLQYVAETEATSLTDDDDDDDDGDRDEGTNSFLYSQQS